MSLIKGRDTKPERIVRSILHKMGYRFRLHVSSLPGRPDIVLPKYKKIIFVNGCFWHGHGNCSRAKLPETRKNFWETKIAANIVRDRKSIEMLQNAGYSCLIIWQCELKNESILQRRLAEFLA